MGMGSEAYHLLNVATHEVDILFVHRIVTMFEI